MFSDSTTREIPLTHGKIAIVDADDFPKISPFRWTAILEYRNNIWYAHAFIGGKMVMLHRYLMNPPIGFMVDHRDRNGLNCRRSNMRLATNAQNQFNSKVRRDNKTGFKGVTKGPKDKKFRAVIQVGKQQCYLGMFETAEEAARAYDAKARETRGEFARVNFPEEGI